MEAAVEAKRYELEQLQAENEQLKSKARVLETAERCSVEIHELMKLLDGLQVSFSAQSTRLSTLCSGAGAPNRHTSSACWSCCMYMHGDASHATFAYTCMCS